MINSNKRELLSDDEAEAKSLLLLDILKNGEDITKPENIETIRDILQSYPIVAKRLSDRMKDKSSKDQNLAMMLIAEIKWPYSLDDYIVPLKYLIDAYPEMLVQRDEKRRTLADYAEKKANLSALKLIHIFSENQEKAELEEKDTQKPIKLKWFGKSHFNGLPAMASIRALIGDIRRSLQYSTGTDIKNIPQLCAELCKSIEILNNTFVNAFPELLQAYYIFQCHYSLVIKDMPLAIKYAGHISRLLEPNRSDLMGLAEKFLFFALNEPDSTKQPQYHQVAHQLFSCCGEEEHYFSVVKAETNKRFIFESLINQDLQPQDVEQIKGILQVNPDLLRQTDKQGKTLSIHAAMNGYYELLQYLIANDSEAHTRADENGKTPAIYAAANGHLDCLKLMIDTIDTNATVLLQSDNHGSTPIMAASSCGHDEMVKLIIETNRDLIYQTDKRGASAAHYAANNGCIGVLQCLIDQDDNVVNHITHCGDTLAIDAADDGHYDVIALLVKKNPKLASQANKFGITPAICATTEGHINILELLFETDSSIENGIDSRDRTLAMVAAFEGRIAVLEFLVGRNNTVLGQSNKKGMTLAMIAAERGRVGVLIWLIEKDSPKLDLLDEEDRRLLLWRFPAHKKEKFIINYTTKIVNNVFDFFNQVIQPSDKTTVTLFKSWNDNQQRRELMCPYLEQLERIFKDNSECGRNRLIRIGKVKQVLDDCKGALDKNGEGPALLSDFSQLIRDCQNVINLVQDKSTVVSQVADQPQLLTL